MTAKFTRADLPMAFTMIETSERIKPRRDGRHSLEKFFLWWTAFRQIYATLAARQGLRTELLTGEDGAVLTEKNGSVRIPRVRPVDEREQIAAAWAEFDNELIQALIAHPSTAFFVERVPFWGGRKLEQDALGQCLNGVIDVNYTTQAEYPVWTPLNREAYQRWTAGEATSEDQALLARQITDLLYTISRNLTHVGKQFDDGQDIAVYEHALPLLELIAGRFVG